MLRWEVVEVRQTREAREVWEVWEVWKVQRGLEACAVQLLEALAPLGGLQGEAWLLLRKRPARREANKAMVNGHNMIPTIWGGNCQTDCVIF